MNTHHIESRVDFGFIRQDEILKTVLPVSSATFWRMVAAEQFPQPVKLGKRITAWRILDVASWSASQSAERKQTKVSKSVEHSSLAEIRPQSSPSKCAIDCRERAMLTGITKDPKSMSFEGKAEILSI